MISSPPQLSFFTSLWPFKNTIGFIVVVVFVMSLPRSHSSPFSNHRSIIPSSSLFHSYMHIRPMPTILLISNVQKEARSVTNFSYSYHFLHAYPDSRGLLSGSVEPALFSQIFSRVHNLVQPTLQSLCPSVPVWNMMRFLSFQVDLM
jgi:hypothetical protein